MKYMFLLAFLIPAPIHAALQIKDLAVFGSSREVVIFLEYDDVTFRVSSSPIHCINRSNRNASFKYKTLGTLRDGENVFPANTTGTGLTNGAFGQIAITNLQNNEFDLLQGYFLWPR